LKLPLLHTVRESACSSISQLVLLSLKHLICDAGRIELLSQVNSEKSGKIRILKRFLFPTAMFIKNWRCTPNKLVCVRYCLQGCLQYHWLLNQIMNCWWLN